MEKKNNAVEKVENLATNAQAEEPTKAELIKEEIAPKKTQKGGKKKTAAKKDKLTPLEKEKRNAKMRLEKAKQKKAKIEQRKKAALARKEANKHKLEQYRLEKLKRKEERIKRRDMLKSESKEQRLERIAAEKQARYDLAQERKASAAAKREERAALRREKIAARRALKEQKRQLRYENKKDRRSRGFGGWLAAVITLGCSTLVLAALFTLALTTNMNAANGLYESTVERTFYDLVSYVDNMDINMSKLMVASESGEQQRLLSELSIQANLAASDITELPLQDESKYYTTKYINQVGDYSKYLNNKLIDGASLSETDKANLGKLYEVNTKLKSDLSELAASLDEDYKFNTLIDESDNNVVLSKFIELESNAVEYPKMIYDGPFSDAKNTQKAKGVSGEEISGEKAQELFKEYFNSYGIESAELVGETHGTIETYNVEGMLTSGEMLYAQISKVGGELIMFDDYKACEAKNYDEKACIKAADEFIKSLGLNNMTAVWTTTSDNTVYLNYVYETKGTIVYPDMIKVTVCMERGEVSAFDATEYYLNHTSRKIATAKLTKEKAMSNISTNLDVENVRLAVIPVGDSEKLCYEVSGTFSGSTYYVYVNALNGKEEQIFRVVETTEGTLLM